MNAMTDLSRLLHPHAATDVDPDTATASATHTVYGVLLLGAMHIALPLTVLREVIPCPPQFSGLPASAPGLLGAVNLRGRVLPVLDLRVSLGLDTPRTDDQVVVVLRHGGALLGLLADGVRGLTRLAAGALGEMSSSGPPLLFSGSFERAEDGTVVSVLDVAMLMRLPGLPLSRDDGAGAPVAALSPQVPRCALMLVRCGSVRLAMDVADVHTTLPVVTLAPSAMDGRVCRGVVEHDGVRLPAIDPLALLGLGTLPDGAACQALLIRFPSGMVAVLVSQVIDIVRVPEAELLALSPRAVQRPELFRAALHVPSQGDHLVLTRGVLQREPELQVLAGLNATPGVAAGNAGASAVATSAALAHARSSTVITYDIGAEVATRLTQVIEVLPFPVDHARPASGHPAVMGLFTHRSHSITLVCLATLLEGSAWPDPAHARVLVVGITGTHFGFIVPRLCHIESTVWEAPSKATTAARPSVLGRHPLVEIGIGSQRRTLHLVDLHALAQGLMQNESAALNNNAEAPEALTVA
jgi:purine-binding chemotaxis protein CheW